MADDTKMCGLLLALLDEIELSTNEYDIASLARQRFEIAEECGYTVEFGEVVSNQRH